MLRAWPEPKPELDERAVYHPLALGVRWAPLAGEAPPPPPLVDFDVDLPYVESILRRGLQPRSLVVDEYGRRHQLEGVEVVRIGLFVNDEGREEVVLEVWPEGEQRPHELRPPSLEAAVWVVRVLQSWRGEPTRMFWFALDRAAEFRAGAVRGVRFVLDDGEYVFTDTNPYEFRLDRRAVEYVTYADGRELRGLELPPEDALSYTDYLRALAPELPIADETGFLKS